MHTFGSLCVRVCVWKNSETKYPVAWLLTNKKRNNVERTDKNDQRVLAAAAAARKAEFVADAKYTLCRIESCAELHKEYKYFTIRVRSVSGIQNNAYENTYIYIKFYVLCVCERGQCCSDCVCGCAAHFYLLISFAEKAQTRWFIFNTHSAVGGKCDCRCCTRILLVHTHTRSSHAHTYRSCRVFAYLLN